MDLIVSSLGRDAEVSGYGARLREQLGVEAPEGTSDHEMYGVAVEICASWVHKHPLFERMASRLAVAQLHRETLDTFAAKVDALEWDLDAEYVGFCREHRGAIEDAIDYAQDYELNYFGLCTLRNGYLLCREGSGEVVERPQDLWMRVSLYLNMGSIDAALRSYAMMASKQFTHATPTLFHAGLRKAQMLSCFLLGIGDSIDGIFDTMKDCATISKWAGGIGIHLSNLRAKGAWVHGTRMESPGIVPMLQVFNQTIRYLNRNSKRHSSVAAYLEPWHADVEAFLDIRTNTGNQEDKCRDIFTALWIPDLFMEHVKDDLNWHLFSPDRCPELGSSWGKAFRKAYSSAVMGGKTVRVVKARDLWTRIVTSQIETGTPYLLYKDSCNAKSNQQNLGTIRSSNLCAEIVQYSDADTYSCCTLASMGLPTFVRSAATPVAPVLAATAAAETKVVDLDTCYDFPALRAAVGQVVRNLDAVIDRNFYPAERTRASNLKYRPLGIGVQGLHDVFQELELPADSPTAAALNRRIFEHLYFAALTESHALAVERGPHDKFDTSPAAEGRLSYDLWGDAPRDTSLPWDALKASIRKDGLRHSLLVACMPTASTSQILGNTECIEPPQSNAFTRRTLTGEFIVSNALLVRKLAARGLWTEDVQKQILQHRGSVQAIAAVPDDLKRVFRTVWEVKQKVLIDLAADRAPFVDQSQSLNLFLKNPTINQVSSMNVYAWQKGLKTGIYYLRTQGASHAEMFSAERATPMDTNEGDHAAPRGPSCEMCSG